MNLLRDAMVTLKELRETHMAESVVYVHGATRTTMLARVGYSTASEIDEYGGMVETRNVDFIIAAGVVTPALGDVVEWDGRKYMLSSKNGAPCWRNADNHGISLRLSTKEMGTI